MAMTGEQAYALAKGYVNQTLQGAGALKGKDGESAYQIALDNGFVGSQTDWLESLKGERGDSGTDGLNGKDGLNGFSPIIVPDADNSDSVYKLDVTTADGTFKTENLKGEQGIQGIRGEQGEAGATGQQGVQGIQGEKGADGYPFLIYKEYETIEEFKASDFPQIGLMFMVKTQDESNAFPVYRYTGEEDAPYSYITGLSAGEAIKGEKGDKGDTGEQGVAGVNGKDGTTYAPTIGTVHAGETASASVVINEDTKEAEFSFVLPKGDKGDIGETGEKGDKGDVGASGKDGADGKTYKPVIGNVQDGEEAQASVDVDESKLEARFNFTLPRGKQGERGEDGRSVTSIRTDDDNNVWVTFSDGKEENIGTLSVDVQADFLTEGGFGKLRYYNGHFQYFDGNNWIDTSVTPDNVYIMNMMPQPMQWIMGVYDHKIGHYKLKWIEPKDTVIEGQVAVVVESIMLRRKKDSAPISENDGELVTIINRADFGGHENAWYIDETFTPAIDNVWYYKAFPVSTTGFYNASPLNETIGIKAKDYELYGFKIDQNESDPASMITYIEDNTQFRSAYMNYDTDRFNYADWNVDDVFFMNVKPCMLKYDGTVAYYLNPNDYLLKENGELSDISDVNFGGNAMVQFPKTYWKIVDNGNNTANIYISDKQIDEGYHCWSHINANGNEIDYCYMPMYNGSLHNGVLRSLSNQTPMHSQTAQAEINYALANNAQGGVENIWYTEVYSDRQLVSFLLLLIGKSTDTQTVFGQGYHTGGTAASSIRPSGQMNRKGFFWGSADNSTVGVKVFGMEHWWGNQWRRIAGWILDHAIQKVKLTYGPQDGSETDGYNLGGEGYIEIPNATPSGTSGGYISTMVFAENGILPKVASGSQTTKFTDGLWYDTEKVSYVGVGGASNYGFCVGSLCTYLSNAASVSGWGINASLSCKPLAS